MDDRHYPARPIVGVGAVVLRGADVLLIRRGKPPRLGEWSLPGGAQELGETVHHTARREVREETGVEIEIVGLIDVIDAIRPDAGGRIESHYTLIDFAARWRSGTPRAGDDALEAAWIEPATLTGLDLWEETLRVIEAARAMLAD